LPTNTLQKGLDVLFLMAQKNAPLKVPDMARNLDIPLSSLYRIISILKKNGLVERLDRDGHIVLGMRNLTLARGVDEQNALIKIANPEMKRLCGRTNESVHLYTLIEDKQICIDYVESPAPIRVISTKGEIMPLYAGAAGKVLLAFLPAGKRSKLLEEMTFEKMASNTITDRHILAEALKKIRKEGFAHSRSELIEGAEGVAAPIFDRMKGVVAGLVIAGPEQRFRQKNLNEIIDMVKGSAANISKALQM
jgi:IclR family KDG regulon transcriptional repressor